MLLSFLLACATLAPQAPTAAPSPASEARRLITEAQQVPASVVPAILQTSRAMAQLPVDDARALGDLVQPLLDRAYFSGENLPGMERLGLVLHKVEKGENPTRIASRYGVGAGMLGYTNPGFDERKLRVGQTLKVLDVSKNPLTVTVVKSRFRAGAWRRADDGSQVLVMFCAVGIGAPESPTPVGVTKITKRVLDPTWTDPDTKKVFPPGDPGNVLGGYWMALDPVGIDRAGIGFHGYTGAPASDWIQKGASHGCVRMLQRDVDRLFHLALEGTTVAISE